MNLMKWPDEEGDNDFVIWAYGISRHFLGFVWHKKPALQAGYLKGGSQSIKSD